MTQEQRLIVELINIMVPALLTYIDRAAHNVGKALECVQKNKPIDLYLVENMKDLYKQFSKKSEQIKEIIIPESFASGIDDNGVPLMNHIQSLMRCGSMFKNGQDNLSNLIESINNLPIKAKNVNNMIDIEKDLSGPYLPGLKGDA